MKRIKEVTGPAYYSWETEKGKKLAFAELSKAMEGFDYRLTGSDRFRNVLPNTSVSDGFSRSDYNWFRPEEASPKDIAGVLSACNKAYFKFGIVRRVIDLMADFASKGIRLTHKQKGLEKIYKFWFKKIRGKERSERFLNYLYRSGNVVVTRTTAKLKPSSFKNMQRYMSSADIEILPPAFKPERREIPWGYTFYDPLTVDIIGGNLAIFSNKYKYALRIPADIRNKITKPKNADEVEIINQLPKAMVEDITKNGRVTLNPNKTKVFHYRKDDWMPWALPMTSSILDDLVVLDKLKLADLVALDGAASAIRIWKIGSMEHKIIPGPDVLEDFKEALLNRVPGAVMDLVHHPLIELDQTNTELSSFLGEEKYRPTMAAIFAGLGIPPTLVAGGGDKGFTNNFISMKTLIESLQYGRDLLTEFWEEEIRVFQDAMGYPSPAKIVFDTMNLSDESGEKALWIQLFDRNIASIESMQERFNLIPEIERYRIDRETKMQKKGRIPPKAGPYSDGEPDLSLKKIYAQAGDITPSEAGVELGERQKGEKTRVERQQEAAKARPTSENKSGTPGQGRPKNSADKGQRKARTPKPRTSLKGSAGFVENMLWAKRSFGTIKNILTKVYLDLNDVEKYDDLGGDLRRELDRFTFNVMCHADQGSDLTEETVKGVVMEQMVDGEYADLVFNTVVASELVNEDEKTADFIGMVYSLYKNDFINI